MFLIVGLGNPGTDYALTRHNVGFMLVERLSSVHGIRCSNKSHAALWGEGMIGAESVILARPLTYMNLSGRAVAALAREFSIPFSSVIVAYDDSDLPLGRIRIRPGGSSGGHRGMESVIAEAGSHDIKRIRLGIGRGAGELKDYVLSRFTADEAPLVEAMLEKAASAVEAIMADGVEAAMNRFNSV